MEILVIDNQPLNLRTLSAFLKDLGHQVACSKNVTRALIEHGEKEETMETIIIDPGENEEEARIDLARIHRAFPDADIVYMDRMIPDSEFSLANKVFAFLRKPVRLSELEVVLFRIQEKRDKKLER